MIRLVTQKTDGTPMVMLGIEPQNLNRLREGQPITVNLRHLVPGGPPTDLPDIEVAIFYAGADELAQLSKSFGVDLTKLQRGGGPGE